MKARPAVTFALFSLVCSLITSVVTAQERQSAAGKLYEEPLPEGALARLGTTRFRLGNMIYAMALSPDGRTAVTVSGNSQTQFWDVGSGKLLRTIEYKEGGGGRVVAYSPNGRLVAYVQDQGPLRLVNAEDGKLLATQPLGTRYSASLAFSPDSAVIATGGCQATTGLIEATKSDSVLALWKWDGTNLKQLWEAKPDHEAPLSGGYAHAIRSLAFSPDGNRLATGSNKGGRIRLWDVHGGKELSQFRTSGDQVRALAFAPSAAVLASGADDGRVILWDLASGTERWSIRERGEVRALAFAPDGKTLVVGGGPEYSSKKGDNPFLVMLDAATGGNARFLAIARSSIASIAFSADGQILAAGLGGNLQFWRGTTAQELFQTLGHANWISQVAFAGDGRTAATAGGDGKIILWDPRTGKELCRFKGHEDEARAVGFVPGGKLLASAGTDQAVRIWDLATGDEVKSLEASQEGLLYALAVSPDGKLVAAGDYHDGSVRIWDLTTGNLTHQFKIADEIGPGIMRLAFSPDSKKLAGGETLLNAGRLRIGQRADLGKSSIYLWDVRSGEKLLKFPAHAQAVMSLSFSPDGATIASTGWSDKSVYLWNANTGARLFELPVGEHHGPACFSPDGKTLAFGFASVSLWDVASKKLIRKLHQSSSYVQSLTYSPDGRLLLAGFMDSTGLAWDLDGKSADKDGSR
jgi:WD40 repeat protein